jgi:hypothetical protein
VCMCDFFFGSQISSTSNTLDKIIFSYIQQNNNTFVYILDRYEDSKKLSITCSFFFLYVSPVIVSLLALNV